MSSAPRHFSIGVIDVSLGSDCKSLLREYSSLYSSCRRGSAAPGAIEINIESKHKYPWPRGPYTLRCPGAPDFEVAKRCEVLPHLEWYINWQIIERRTEYVQLHASALEFEGQAMVMPGDPGSGKTTLTAGLLRRGWSYLCDEFALIDPVTSQVQPYPRALCIKEGSFSVIERLGIPLCRKTSYQKPTKGRVAFLNPLDVRADVVGNAAPVRWVVFPRYVADATPTLRPITRSQAVYDLAKQCFTIRVDQKRTLQCLAPIVRGAECYQLVTNDIDATCDLVEALRVPRVARRAG